MVSRLKGYDYIHFWHLNILRCCLSDHGELISIDRDKTIKLNNQLFNHIVMANVPAEMFIITIL